MAVLPRKGVRVITSDHEVIGEVAAVVEPCFKVDKPLRPDDWLPLELIARLDDEGDVHLSATRAELEGKPEGIEHFGFHVHDG